MKRTLGLLLGMGLLFAGCEAVERAQGHYSPFIFFNPNPFVGKWISQDAEQGMATLNFRRDRVYELDVEGDGVPDVWGRYQIIFEKEIVFKAEGGNISHDCYQSGIYNYRFSWSRVRYYLIGDQCTSRKQLLSAPWKRKGNQ